jgi:hypothetical protein
MEHIRARVLPRLRMDFEAKGYYQGIGIVFKGNLMFHSTQCCFSFLNFVYDGQEVISRNPSIILVELYIHCIQDYSTAKFYFFYRLNCSFYDGLVGI